MLTQKQRVQAPAPKAQIDADDKNTIPPIQAKAIAPSAGASSPCSSVALVA